MLHILVVEDNLDLRELLCNALHESGYRAIGAENGEQALAVLSDTVIDLIIADIMMPKMNGFELTKNLRELNIYCPLLIVTAREDYESLQKAFTLGADDYMVKPINVKELLVRVKALLRRAKISAEKKIVIGSTVLDHEGMTVNTGGHEVILPLKEFNLLFKLLSYPGKIFTRQQLMDEIWGMDSDTDDRTINTHINRLRDKFEDNPDFKIVTIRGLGYKAVKNDRMLLSYPKKQHL